MKDPGPGQAPVWHETAGVRHDGGVLTADVRVPAASRWFDGHFPGNPVLPGIAQLAMVADLIRSALGGSTRVLEVSRVRFKQMILPGERLQVVAEPRPGRAGAYAFRLTKGETVVCSGTMTVGGAGSRE